MGRNATMGRLYKTLADPVHSGGSEDQNDVTILSVPVFYKRKYSSGKIPNRKRQGLASSQWTKGHISDNFRGLIVMEPVITEFRTQTGGTVKSFPAALMYQSANVISAKSIEIKSSSKQLMTQFKGSFICQLDLLLELCCTVTFSFLYHRKKKSS